MEKEENQFIGRMELVSLRWSRVRISSYGLPWYKYAIATDTRPIAQMRDGFLLVSGPIN